MNQRIEALQAAIAPQRAAIVAHPMYQKIQTLQHLQAFSEMHVFAVWDFMSLLKSLQQKLTCITQPWMPVGSAETRFLINEIVTGEESDVDMQGNRTSHFELYVKAMHEAGADLHPIGQFIEYLKNGVSVTTAMQKLQLPEAVQQFVSYTFHTIHNLPVHAQAAVFTFGREDLIPDMFRHLVADLQQRFPGRLDTFRYYLERHIEVDGDHHSHLGYQMVAELCGDDAIKWTEATAAAKQSLVRRHQLWDGVLARIQQTNLV
ncbi:MAG TPA: heme oxygenase [Chitinophagaceae bacterium]|nr:heme oxygenase [Chitinophagaceae bacterium]